MVQPALPGGAVGWLEVQRGDSMAETAALERRRRMRLLLAAEQSEKLTGYLKWRATTDPHFWFDHFFWSYDGEIEEGPPHVPSPPLDFQRDYIDLFLGTGDTDVTRNADGGLWPVACDKSRKLGATWFALGAVVWDWAYNEAADYGILTRSGTDLDGGVGPQSLFGKIFYILDRLPWWLQPNYRDGSHPIPFLYNVETGATIEGSRTVRDAFRGKRHKRDFVDEAAFVPHMEDVMASLNEVSKAPFLVSTPCGMGNTFARRVHGEGVTVHDFGEEHQGDGWCHFRMHYSQHPERDPTTARGRRWMEAKRARMTELEWAQELEIDYNASLPGQIWPEWCEERHVLTDPEWTATLRWFARSPSDVEYIEAWDFGSGASHTAVVWAAYYEPKDRLYLIDYRNWQGRPPDEVAYGVAQAGWYTDRSKKGRRPHWRIGDTYGKAVESDQRSWVLRLADYGIEVTGRYLDGEAARMKARIAIKNQKLIAAPAVARRWEGQQPHVPTLSESITQYRRNLRGRRLEDYSGQTPKPKKDKYSHLADAVQYVVDHVWPDEVARTRAQD